MLKHVAMWRLKDQAEGADRSTNAARVKAALEALRGRIPGLLALEVGIDVDRSPAAFDVVLCTTFESPAALAAYRSTRSMPGLPTSTGGCAQSQC